MTQIAQTSLRTPIRVSGRAVAGIALAAALLGGIAGSAFQTLTRPAAPTGSTVSARDLVVLQGAHDWETRYVDMYPNDR